jgi:hypothetical protein
MLKKSPLPALKQVQKLNYGTVAWKATSDRRMNGLLYWLDFGRDSNVRKILNFKNPIGAEFSQQATPMAPDLVCLLPRSFGSVVSTYRGPD